MTVIPRRPKTDSEKTRFEKAIDARQAQKQAEKDAINNPPPPSRRVEILNTKRRLGVAESPDLRDARLAEEKRRADLKNSPPAKTAPIELELADKLALLEAFCGRTPSFARTQWNLEMLNRCITYNIAVGKVSFSSSGLDSIYRFLRENGYLENQIRHRGDRAPREFPEYVPQPPALDINAKVPLQQPAVTQVISLAERQRLMNMPLDELAATVRSGYREYKTKGGR